MQITELKTSLLVCKEITKACDWFEKAARHGNEEALQKIIELAKNDNKALQLLEKLPQNNRSDIQLAIGNIYFAKNEVDMACDWLEKSAKQNNKKALHKLHKLAQKRNDIQFAIGSIYLDRNEINNACEWFEKSFKQDNNKALQKIRELAQNNKALKRFEASAKIGNLTASNILKLIAKNGNPMAQFLYGNVCLAANDFNNACIWYEKSIKQGIKEARSKLEIANREKEKLHTNHSGIPNYSCNVSYAQTAAGNEAHAFRDYDGKFGSYPIYDNDSNFYNDD